MGDVLFDNVLLEVGDRDVETFRRNETSLVEGILVRVPQGDEFGVGLEVGKRERRDPFQKVTRGFVRRLEAGDETEEIPLRRGAVEPADAHVDGMNLAAADAGDDAVSDLLQLERAGQDRKSVV